ncbi:hypothetical protein D3C75_1155300 [compost metagenome]
MHILDADPSQPLQHILAVLGFQRFAVLRQDNRQVHAGILEHHVLYQPQFRQGTVVGFVIYMLQRVQHLLFGYHSYTSCGLVYI